MRLALAQINAVVGDPEATASVFSPLSPMRAPKRAELIVFPELAVAGYPPEDLLLRPPSSAQRTVDARDRGGDRRDRRARRHAVGVRRGAVERMCRLRRGRAAGALPEAASLRRSTRSATSSRAPTGSCCRSAACASA